MIKVAKEAKEEAKEIMEAKEGVMGRKVELKKINEATSKKQAGKEAFGTE